jgi:N-acetyl-gamma-glutamyl-phosphate reductase
MVAKRRIGIIGASGYTGVELLRLVAQHPDLEMVLATGDSQAGTLATNLYPSLATVYPNLVFSEFEAAACDGLDAVFLGVPHEAALDIAPQLVGRVGTVVDLSAAYRLKDASLYPTWYKFEHTQPALLAQAVYGLPELTRGELKGAELIATPGCHVTAASLVLQPLVEAGFIEPTGVIVNSITGVSGAGRVAKNNNLFCTVNEDVLAYGLLDHRHTPEIEQVTGAQVLFTPHLAPMNRGILATCYARPATGKSVTTAGLLGELARKYRGEPFVSVRTDSPSTKATLGSNSVHMSARYDERTNTVLLLCAIDNLAKGASGGALQAMNVSLGLDETAGLAAVGLFP